MCLYTIYDYYTTTHSAYMTFTLTFENMLPMWQIYLNQNLCIIYCRLVKPERIFSTISVESAFEDDLVDG